MADIIENENNDYRWDCIDTEITELPDIISWCKEGVFDPIIVRIGFNSVSDIDK